MSTLFTNYANKVEPSIAWVSDETQVIVNSLPEHSAIRRDASSVGFGLVNDIAGKHVELIKKMIDRERRDNYLVTASYDNPYYFWRFALDRTFDITPPINTVNLLHNSSFDIASDASWICDDWDWNSYGTISRVAGARSSTAIKLESASPGIEFAQLIQTRYPANTPFTLSFLYRTGGSFYGLARIIATHPDSTTTTQTLVLDASTDFRLGTTTKLSWTKAIERLVVSFYCSSGYLVIDDAILEMSKQRSTWRPHILDRFRWIEPTEGSPVFINSPVYSQYVGLASSTKAKYDWWYSYPTRASLLSTEGRTAESLPVSFPIGTQTFYDRSQYVLSIKQNGNQIQRMCESTGDIFANYTLQFPTLDGQYYSPSYTLDTFTVFRETIFAIVSKTDWTGATKKYLAFMPCVFPQEAQTSATPYASTLQIRGLIELDISETVQGAYFMQEESSILYLLTSYNKRAFRLKYDYFLLDDQTGSIFLHENDSNTVSVGYMNNQRRA